MIGLLALLFFVLWGFVAYKISEFLTKKIKTEKLRKIAFPVLSVLILFVPVFDEIIGGFQFRKLCSESLELIVDEKKSRGKTVVSNGAEFIKIDNYFVPIVETKRSFKDINSGEVLVGWNTYLSEGGWLSRSLNILSSAKPYTFNGVCISPKWNKSIFSDLEINVVYK